MPQPRNPVPTLVSASFLALIGLLFACVAEPPGTTLDCPPPPFVTTTPADGDTNVALDDSIFVTLSEPVDSAFLDTGTIVLTVGDDTVPGTLIWHPEDSTLVFDPVDSLIPDTTYTVTLTLPTDSLTPLGPVDTVITWTFTTVDSIPNPPQPEAINNGTTLSLTAHNNPILELYWFPAAGPTATTYRLQVSSSPTFATTVFDLPGIPNNSFIVRGDVPTASLPPNTYYWRVSATNSGGTSNWSVVWSFTTTP